MVPVGLSLLQPSCNLMKAAHACQLTWWCVSRSGMGVGGEERSGWLCHHPRTHPVLVAHTCPCSLLTCSCCACCRMHPPVVHAHTCCLGLCLCSLLGEEKEGKVVVVVVVVVVVFMLLFPPHCSCQPAGSSS